MRTRNSIKSLLLVFALVCTTALQAQSGYQNKLKALFQVNTAMSGMDFNQQRDSYVKMLQAGGASNEAAQALCNEYFRTQYMDDLVKVIAPYYQNVMSEADIDSMIALFGTPEGIAAMDHIGKASAVMSSPEAQAFMQNSLMGIFQGQQMTGVGSEACSAVYQQKFEEYYVLFVESNVTSMLSSLEPMFMGMAQTESQKVEIRKLLNTTTEFLTKNLKVFYLNAFYPDVTEADLDFYLGMMKTPAGQNMNKGSVALSKDAMNVGVQMLKEFTAWVEKQQ